MDLDCPPDAKLIEAGLTLLHKKLNNPDIIIGFEEDLARIGSIGQARKFLVIVPGESEGHSILLTNLHTADDSTGV